MYQSVAKSVWIAQRWEHIFIGRLHNAHILLQEGIPSNDGQCDC
jgi:hypothetical protein